MMYWNGHLGAVGWVLSSLWTLMILALLVAGVLWLVTALSERGRSTHTSQLTAREILDRRLARGELAVEQYNDLCRALEHGPTSAGEGSQEVPPGAAPMLPA
jgi:uncharacterized membrane protein